MDSSFASPQENLGRRSKPCYLWYSFTIHHKLSLWKKNILFLNFLLFNFSFNWCAFWQAHIERALHDHFLFRKLTASQCHVLLDCMQRVEFQAGDVVVKQVMSFSVIFCYLSRNLFSKLFLLFKIECMIYFFIWSQNVIFFVQVEEPSFRITPHT